MQAASFTRLRRALGEIFPERVIYIRSAAGMRGIALTTGKQVGLAAGVVALGLWLGVSTAALLIGAVTANDADKEIAKVQARSDRWVADRQARLDNAVAQLNAQNGSIDQIAADVEKRHAALALLLTDFKGEPGAIEALKPAKRLAAAANPVQRIQATRLDQERLIEAAETFAKSRAERLRLAFRLAGLDPASFARADGASGGPLIEAKDSRALAAELDIDDDFAARIQEAAQDVAAVKGLSASAETLPFARPTSNPELSSSYGVRIDPFTHLPAFHSGLDFPGAFLTPISATAPGVVSYVGERSGYGNVVEIDHGRGFKTRYAHLAGISVGVGQRVAVGQRIGAMGSTGRSTGTHLHYEVWVGGRAQNPNRFLRAGDYVQQAD